MLKTTISERSIRKYLIHNDLRAFRKSKKALLTTKMVKKRFEWAKKMQSKEDGFWDKVIFSDESYISLYSGHPIYTRRSKNSKDSFLNARNYNMAPKHPIKVMIWGCFSRKGVGMVKVVNETMKSESYIDVLKNKLIPSARQMFGDNEYIFQDDSAPCHRSKIVKKFEVENQIDVLEWPGNSPDMNPIENLWAILKQKVNSYQPKTRTELVSSIVRVWHHEIPIELCEKLVDSMNKRISTLYQNKGGPTKY